MSGIFGSYRLDGSPVDVSLIGRMSSRLAHRGPDGEGAWVEGSVGLGHRMLHVTPESLHEEQPARDRTHSAVLVADARLDNRDDLLRELRPNGSSKNISDSALMLAAYERWGTACPEHFVGDFAFVVWDGQQRWLFGARDQFGVKPLYYHHAENRRFVFGSEIKAVLCDEQIPRDPDEVRIADYLVSLTFDKEITFYKHVKQIPAACSFLVAGGNFRKWQYWQLDPEREVTYQREADYAEGFRERFEEAVRCRLRSAHPVGASLSGGLDSSSVVTVADRLLDREGRPPLHTFSAVFEVLKECDESDFIAEVLKNTRADSHFLTLDRQNAFANADRILCVHDQPPFVRNTFLWTLKYDMAHALGVRVMLDGEDGDTVVSHGEGYLAELARSGQWQTFGINAVGLMRHFQMYDPAPTYLFDRYGSPALADFRREGRWIELAKGLVGAHRHLGVSGLEVGKSHVLKPLVRTARNLVRPSANGETAPGETALRRAFPASAIVRRDFLSRINYYDRLREAANSLREPRTLREMHWQGLTSQSSWAYEEQDRTAASRGLVARHPFHDRRLVEYCLALPPDQKLRDGWPRWIIRKAMEGVLPPAVQWRVGKSNLGANFKRTFFDRNRATLEDLLFQNDGPVRQYLNEPVIQKSFELGVANYAWPAAMLASWLKSEA